MDQLDEGGSRCGRCDSPRLRRSHSRSDLQKLLRRHTGFDRYACTACGHRGWTWGKVPRRGLDGGPVISTGSNLAGRRLERRDHRLRRTVRVKSFLTVAAALVLGVTVAVYLQRCGIPSPTVE
jgi:hypothetical protein